MAIHDEPEKLSVEVIEEYLFTVAMCLNHRKADGGCLGYSATLLLFCVVDALGGYLALDKSNGIPKGEPFRVLCGDPAPAQSRSAMLLAFAFIVPLGLVAFSFLSGR